MDFPKILIISNNCFSLSTNNGRTLGNFFSGWDKEKIAQFYIKPEIPQKDICANYLCVSDETVLNIFKRKKSIKGIQNALEQSGDSNGQSIKRNSFTMIARYWLWSLTSWEKKSGFYKFVDDFAPDAVLLQAGDTPHMYDLTRKIAKKRNIPIIMYNSEDYVFRTQDYFEKSSFFAKLAYPIFRKMLRTSFVKILKQTTHVIYISDKLQRTYNKIYKHQSSVIYTSTAATPSESLTSNDPLVVSYFGNLHLDRYISLIELANAFREVDPRIKVDVYGEIPTNEIKNALEECKAIRTHGFVPYDVVRRVMAESDILLHAESFAEYYQSINANYFTTKIADCLASGKAFLVYAPSHIAFMEYLRDHDAAILIDSPKDLKKTVEKVVASEEFRNSRVEKARLLAAQNHDFGRNRETFQRIIKENSRKV